MSPISAPDRRAPRRRLAAHRRLRGFAAGLTALVAVSTATAFGIAGSEIRARRAFDYATTPESVAAPGPARSAAASVMSPAVLREVRGVSRQPGVALIGDSWVSKSKLDAPLAAALAERGLGHLPVRGLGQGGATSRVILRNLMSRDGGEFASGELLEDARFRYCIVIAGVNDSANHIGADFYAHHVAEITQLLLSKGITPIVLELPEYGIEAVREKREGIRLVKDVVLSALYDDGEVDVIRKYRRALARELAERRITDRVELVRFDPIVADYHDDIDLYRDAAHLNDEGRARLVATLARVVEARLAQDAAAQRDALRLASR